ncbi:hypothetical protein V8E54_010929 [Elaphomyces granulatus]
MAIEQANAEATRARQDRIAEAEIEAIRSGRHAGATTFGGTNDSGETPPVDTALLKDYGRTPSIWTEGFINYTAILVEFFGAEFPGLHIGLSRFMLDIIELEKIYDWQTAVLPLALQFHEELADEGLCSDPHQWTLDRQYVDRFCNATRLRNVRPNLPLSDSVSKGIVTTTYSPPIS